MRYVAWEISDEDAFAILHAHDQTMTLNDRRVQTATDHLRGQIAKIQAAALEETELDAQTEAALAVAEDLLLANHLIQGPKHFPHHPRARAAVRGR